MSLFFASLQAGQQVLRWFILGLVLVLAACYHRSAPSEVTATGGGPGGPPNGADPKAPAVRPTPEATLPPLHGQLTLGRGVNGSMLPVLPSIFAPPSIASISENVVAYGSSETSGLRVHSQASSFSVSVGADVPALFSAGVSYRSSSETHLTESTHEFYGYIRKVTQRDFLSIADGHVALVPDVLSRLAQADQARLTADLPLLMQIRADFIRVYGIGFLSEHVRGHEMDLRSYTQVSSSNYAQIAAVGTSFGAFFATGSFSSAQALATALANASMFVIANGRGVIQAPTTIFEFATFAQNFNTNLTSHEILWSGIASYEQVPQLDALFAPFAGSVDYQLGATLQRAPISLPTLNRVGEVLSLGSYAKDLDKTIWLSPYLFPGSFSASGGQFTLNVRPFDLLKVLCRDTAFRGVAQNFVAQQPYAIATAATPVVLPISAGGPQSAFPQYPGPYYHINVEHIRPVLAVRDPIANTMTTIPARAADWRPVSGMGLESFGSNACGLFRGTASLAYSYADVQGQLAAAAQQGNLLVRTEVKIGNVTIMLQEEKTVTGDFGVQVLIAEPQWGSAGPNSGFTYTGTAQAVLVRFPVNWDQNSPWLNVAPGIPHSVRLYYWHTLQDVVMHATPNPNNRTHSPTVTAQLVDSRWLTDPNGWLPRISGAEVDCNWEDSFTLPFAAVANAWGTIIRSNRLSPSTLNFGTTIDILVLAL